MAYLAGVEPAHFPPPTLTGNEVLSPRLSPDQGLREIIGVWPLLPADLKAAVLAIVRVGKQSGGQP